MQFDRIPATQVKLGFDYHPGGAPYGASVSLVHLGDMDDEPSVRATAASATATTQWSIWADDLLRLAPPSRLDLHLNNALTAATHHPWVTASTMSQAMPTWSTTWRCPELLESTTLTRFDGLICG